MYAYELSQLKQERLHADILYLEFLKVPALSTGLYHLEAGSTDPQHPHTEDEVYFVVEGKGEIRVAGEDRNVAAGSIVYVPAGTEHRFHNISEDLIVLVFFAPAEGTLADQA